MSIVSKAVQSAKSVLKKIPGSDSAVRVFEKTRAHTKGELDSKKVADIFDADKSVAQPTENISVPVEQEDLDKICNISRLRESHRCAVNGQKPALPPFDYSQAFVYQRKLYARYGAASGVDPRKLWPADKEVESAKTLDSLKYMMTIDDVLTKVATLKAEAAEREAQMRARDEEVAANIVKMEKIKEKMYTDAVKVEEELQEAEERRNKRIEQVRRFFQYTLDVKDPRFREKMLEMIQNEKDALKAKSKEEKKLQKQEQKAKAEAAKLAAIKARREAKSKAGGDSSDDE